MAKITTVKTHESGIALGGIGEGSVELLPDGESVLKNLSDSFEK